MEYTLQHRPEEKSSKEEKKYYQLLETYAHLLAPFYNLFFLTISLGEEWKLRDKVAAEIRPRVGDRILDLATGTGKQAIALAKINKTDVIAVDMSRHMISIAKNKNKHRNLTFALADATRLPLKGNSFDISCVSFGLHDMILPVREKAVVELVRVTREKGTIAIVDYAVPKTTFLRFFGNIARLYEPYYSEFTNYNLEKNLISSGMKIQKKIQMLQGVGRMLIGNKLPLQPKKP